MWQPSGERANPVTGSHGGDRESRSGGPHGSVVADYSRARRLRDSYGHAEAVPSGLVKRGQQSHGQRPEASADGPPRVEFYYSPSRHHTSPRTYSR